MVMGEGDDLIIFNHARTFPSLHVPWFSTLDGPELLTGAYAGLYLPGGSDFAYQVGMLSQEYYFPRGGSADVLLQQAKFQLGRTPRAEHIYVYDAVQLMARAILLAGTYDGQAIADKIPQAAQSYPAATGPFFFDGNGDRDAGELAYTCMVPTGGPYEYHYCGFFHGDSLVGAFQILSAPQPRDLEWLR
jgi:branched-chain amino acid transport system substrate-binding protein